VFAAELTTGTDVCEGCGRNRIVAEPMLYGSALEAVLRRSGCDLAMIRLVRTPVGQRIDMRGVTLMRMPLWPDAAGRSLRSSKTSG
jgi:hypothetical protein